MPNSLQALKKQDAELLLGKMLDGFVPDEDGGKKRPFRQALYEALLQARKEGKI